MFYFKRKDKKKNIMRSKIDGYKDIHTWSETNNYKIDIRCYTYFVCVFKESNFFQIYSVYIENESLTETKKTSKTLFNSRNLCYCHLWLCKCS